MIASSLLHHKLSVYVVRCCAVRGVGLSTCMSADAIHLDNVIEMDHGMHFAGHGLGDLCAWAVHNLAMLQL